MSTIFAVVASKSTVRLLVSCKVCSFSCIRLFMFCFCGFFLCTIFVLRYCDFLRFYTFLKLLAMLSKDPLQSRVRVK